MKTLTTSTFSLVKCRDSQKCTHCGQPFTGAIRVCRRVQETEAVRMLHPFPCAVNEGWMPPTIGWDPRSDSKIATTIIDGKYFEAEIMEDGIYTVKETGDMIGRASTLERAELLIAYHAGLPSKWHDLTGGSVPSGEEEPSEGDTMATATAPRTPKGPQASNPAPAPAAPRARRAPAAAAQPSAPAPQARQPRAPQAPAPAAAQPARPSLPPTALTTEELQAAVDGVLTVRPKDPRAGQATGTVGENGRASGRPIGRTTNLPIFGAFCLVFQENEKPKGECAIKGLGHASDAKIGEWLRSEFPDRDNTAFNDPNLARAAYNKGRYTRNTQPGVESHRFDDQGNIVVGRRRGAAAEEAQPEPTPAPAPAPRQRRAAAPAAAPAPVPAPAPARQAVRRAPAPAAVPAPARRPAPVPNQRVQA